MSKAALHQKIERSRKRHGLREGQDVFYPVPLPPISHDESGGELEEVAVPVGEVVVEDETLAQTLGVEVGTVIPAREEWLPATVKSIDHHRNDSYPDDYVAVLETEHGELALSVVYVRAERP